MSNFDDTLARMKALCTYGMVNESETKQPNSTLEITKKAADGKYYGIVKEFNSYYIKQSTEGKQSLVESYNYIGGFMNKKDYQYDSYNNALKHLELKLSSINEACEGKVNIATLDPFKKEIVLAEASDKMKESIARQRQIMYNASMLMNESIGFSNTGVPEANHTANGSGSVDKNAPFTDPAKYEEEHKGTANNPEKQGKPFGNAKAPENGKDVKDNNVPSNGASVAAQHPKGGKVTKVNEVASPTDTDLDAGVPRFGSTERGEADTEHNNKPFEQTVNEEGEKEWGSEGLPADSQAGTGEPDTDQNNKPFNKNINEADEDEESLLIDDEEDVDLDDDELFVGDEEEGEDTFDNEEEDFVDDDEYVEIGEEEEFVDDEEPLETEFEPETDDLEGEEEIEDFDEEDPEALRAEIERLEAKLAELEGESEEEPEIEGEEEFVEDEDVDELPEEGEEEGLGIATESKKQLMNQIIESVVKSYLNEDELHVFGEHPGYRREPMTRPQTGEDKNAHGADINDESAHSEEPFGKQIGDSSPFNELVKAVYNDVAYQLKHGVPLDNKKKVD